MIQITGTVQTVIYRNEDFLITKLLPNYKPSRVERYGADATKVIEDEGETCLTDIWGIGENGMDYRQRQSHIQIQNMMIQLQKYGIIPNMIMKAYKGYKSITTAVILNNPYKLMRVNLVGLQLADEIAR